MKKLFSQVVAAIAGLWLAALFVPLVVVRVYPESSFFGIPLAEQWQILLVLGIIKGYRIAVRVANTRTFQYSNKYGDALVLRFDV